MDIIIIISTELVILIGGVLAGSFVSGLAGMGGGALLLLIMSMVLAPQILIPVHGVVQIGSSISRGSLNFKSIDWSIACKYLAGATLEAAIRVHLNKKFKVENFVSVRQIKHQVGTSVALLAYKTEWRYI